MDTQPSSTTFSLRKNNKADDLYLIGPKEDGAEQLRAYGYNFTGPPPVALSFAVSGQFPEILWIAETLSLSTPTIYFAERIGYLEQAGTFIEGSSDDPMIVLIATLVLKQTSDLRKLSALVLGLVVHELGRAHVEKFFGDCSAVQEAITLQFKERYLQADSRKARSKVLAIFRDFIATP